MKFNWRQMFTALSKIFVSAVITTIVLFSTAIILSGPSQQERQQTAENVRRLVRESELNRELVCLAVLLNENNPSREDPRLREICRDVGVSMDGP